MDGAAAGVGLRWWNHRRPAAYLAAMASGDPRAGQETLGAEEAHIEAVMLGLRLAEGLPAADLRPHERERAEAYLASGHLLRREGRYCCTLSGRLIADGIVRDILD